MWVANTRVFKKQKMEGLFTTAEQSLWVCHILTHISSWNCFLFHCHRSRSPFLRFLSVFAVVLVSFGNQRAGSCTSQDMHEIHSDTDNIFTAVPRLFAQNMALLFFMSRCFTLVWKYFEITTGFSLRLYMRSSFTIWKRHHVAVNTLLCFTCHAVSELSPVAVFAVFTVEVTIWEHCFTLLWIQISPHEVTTDSPLAEISPGFSSDFPSLTFLQPCHLGSLGVSHHGTNWRDDKNKYQYDSEEALQFPEAETPNSWKSTNTFMTRMYPLVCSFTEPFNLPVVPETGTYWPGSS